MAVYWDQLSWEAFATLATGFAAVIAATIIGLRQAKIASKQAEISGNQTEILKRQVALQEQTFRAELYERRMHIYNSAKSYYAACLSFEPLSDGVQDGITESAGSAAFLFNEEFSDALLDFYYLGMGLKHKQHELSLMPDHDSRKRDLEDELNSKLGSFTARWMILQNRFKVIQIVTAADA